MNGRWEASPRRARRNRLLLAGLLPSLAALVVAAGLLLTLARNEAGLAAYHDGRYEPARDHFGANRWLAAVEPWVAPFNEGDAHFRLDDYDAALDAYRAALRAVPAEHECRVRLNIALTRERLGDAVREAGSTAAEDAWRDARSALAAGRCTERLVEAAPEVTEEARTTDERLASKILDSLAARERERRARLDPVQRDRIARQERQDERAQQRDEQRRDRPPPQPDLQEPDDPAEDYAW